MKKIAFSLTLIAMIASAAVCAAPQTKLKKIPFYFPNGKKISVDIADTPAEREKGLMFRKHLPKDYGMLFIFSQQLGMEFWMKNTWTSLDIIYIDSDKKITRIHERVKPSTAKTTDADVARVGGVGQYVLELPAGTSAREKFQVGQAFNFVAAIPLK